jgi:hypothetical protein
LSIIDNSASFSNCPRANGAERRFGRKPGARLLIPPGYLHPGKGKERKGKERKGKERKGKERKGKERKGKERKGKR